MDINQVTRKLSCMGIVVLQEPYKEPEVLVMENDGEIVFPKGHVEPAEAHIAAAVREVYEETGVTVQLPDHLGKIDQFEFYFEGEKAIKVIEVHLFKITAKQSTNPNLSEGITSSYWMSTTEALIRLTHNDAKKSLSKALAKIKSNE